jgi:hypothetical protein
MDSRRESGASGGAGARRTPDRRGAVMLDETLISSGVVALPSPSTMHHHSALVPIWCMFSTGVVAPFRCSLSLNDFSILFILPSCPARLDGWDCTMVVPCPRIPPAAVPAVAPPIGSFLFKTVHSS